MSHRNEELWELVRDFRTVSKVTVAIYDAERSIVATSDHIPFCSEIRKNPDINSRCRSCDLMGFSKCADIKKAYLYRCHMGLMEISAPIMYGDTLLGYMIFGQFTDSPDRSVIRSKLLSASKAYGFDISAPLRESDDIMYFDSDSIEALTRLIEMCTNYIWLNNIIGLNGSNLAHEIRLYITAHLSEELSVDSLCLQYSLSPTALYQIFKKAFGTGVVHIIREERIRRAKELLENSELSVGEIAYRVGIPDANYFTRVFRQHTGMTPREVRSSKALALG